MDASCHNTFPAQLRAFHAAHFPGQRIPECTTFGQQAQYEDAPDQSVTAETDDLGFYADGVKRTLTDEQIRMFRHSEIQRLLTERRLAKEQQEKETIRADRAAASLSRRPEARPFLDEPASAHSPVDTLIYDDPPPTQPQTRGALKPAEKKFLWPVLGQPT
jgi:hypothetical protein